MVGSSLMVCVQFKLQHWLILPQSQHEILVSPKVDTPHLILSFHSTDKQGKQTRQNRNRQRTQPEYSHLSLLILGCTTKKLSACGCQFWWTLWQETACYLSRQSCFLAMAANIGGLLGRNVIVTNRDNLAFWIWLPILADSLASKWLLRIKTICDGELTAVHRTVTSAVN